MKKKILATVLSLVMLLTALPLSVFAEGTEPEIVLYVTPDKTEATVGDVITYTVSIWFKDRITCLEFDPVLPDSLEYVPYSGKLFDNAKDLLTFESMDWTEKTQRTNGFKSVPIVMPEGYDSVELSIFSAQLTENALDGEEITIGLSHFAFGDENFLEITDIEVVNTASVTVLHQCRVSLKEGTDATCEEEGTIDSYVCSCGKIYLDESAENEVTEAELIIPALGHTEVTDEAAEPDCTNTGLTEGKHCEVCGEIITAQEEVPALGHTEVTDEAAEPDCTNTGLTEGKHCEVCGEIITAQEEVPALGHTEVTDEAAEPDCTNTGLTEGKHCEVCGEIITAQEEVPALGHTEVTDEAAEPDCTNTGLTEGKHCEICGEIITAQEEVPALGHSYESVVTEPTVTSEGFTTNTCSVCGETYISDRTPALTAVITGSVTSFRSDTDAITIELIRDGENEAAYTVTVYGKEAEYSLEGVEAGEYILRASKKDHVTRDYEITVESPESAVDVKIHLLGDVDGNGKVNTVDVSKANSHVKSVSILGEYEAKCADVNEDGHVKTPDVARINAHAKAVDLLW